MEVDKNNSFGKLPPFSCSDVSLSEGRNKWQVWLRGFEICLRACKITDPGEKRDMLLAQGGIELQEIFFNIPEPDDEKMEDVDPYKIAIDMIDGYFGPRRLEVEERNQFWSMKPNSDESLPKFLKRVQEHASKCNFGKTETESQNFAVIDKMLQFLPEPLKKRLLRESSLTIDDMIKRMNESESSTPAASTGQASKNNNSNSQKVVKPCKFCGKNHGKERQCPAWNKNCSICGKPGHFSYVCYSPAAAQGASKKTKRSQAFLVAKKVPGASLKQDWPKNYAQTHPAGSLRGELAKDRVLKKPWKKDYEHPYPVAGGSSDELVEGRAMKYARSMYGIDDMKMDYALPRGTNYSEWSPYHQW